MAFFSLKKAQFLPADQPWWAAGCGAVRGAWPQNLIPGFVININLGSTRKNGTQASHEPDDAFSPESSGGENPWPEDMQTVPYS
jgi:hypothetical protein